MASASKGINLIQFLSPDLNLLVLMERQSVEELGFNEKVNLKTWGFSFLLQEAIF